VTATPAPTVPAFRTVLCAVDFSEHSEAALYLAAGLTCSRGSRLVVLHVRSGGGEPSEDAALELSQFVHYRALRGGTGYREGIDCVVSGGDPAAAILDTAAARGAELIVIGTRGRGALLRSLLGSTTAAVLERATVPVAIVPPSHPEVVSIAAESSHAAPHFGIILVAIDLADTTYAQLEFAARLSPGSAHRLLMMTVVDHGDSSGMAMQRLRALATSVTTARGSRLLVKEGSAVERLLSVLEHESIGVVVLGRSNRRPGRVAHELLANGRAVVVVVPCASGKSAEFQGDAE
jgi:nucleotide-binding universal stress UspA family protein